MTRHWPMWSVREAPADLARYVVPEVVRRHVRVPIASKVSVLHQLHAVWDVLRAAGIGYAREYQRPDGDEWEDRWIRPPGELLVAPRNGTCLDLAVLLAGACACAGLRTAVLLLDAAQPGPSASRPHPGFGRRCGPRSLDPPPSIPFPLNPKK
jgi:hypothetical protein